MVYCYNNPKACKGNDTCIEGNIGVLCEQCDIENDYFKSGIN